MAPVTQALGEDASRPPDVTVKTASGGVLFLDGAPMGHAAAADLDRLMAEYLRSEGVRPPAPGVMAFSHEFAERSLEPDDLLSDPRAGDPRRPELVVRCDPMLRFSGARRPWFIPGCEAVLCGLKSAPALNGRSVRVIAWHPGQSRYEVRPSGDVDAPTKSVKPDNLQWPPESDTTETNEEAQREEADMDSHAREVSQVDSNAVREHLTGLGVEQRYHKLIARLCHGRLECLKEVRAHDLESQHTEDGERIIAPVARSLARTLAATPPAALDPQPSKYEPEVFSGIDSGQATDEVDPMPTLVKLRSVQKELRKAQAELLRAGSSEGDPASTREMRCRIWELEAQRGLLEAKVARERELEHEAQERLAQAQGQPQRHPSSGPGYAETSGASAASSAVRTPQEVVEEDIQHVEQSAGESVSIPIIESEGHVQESSAHEVDDASLPAMQRARYRAQEVATALESTWCPAGKQKPAPNAKKKSAPRGFTLTPGGVSLNSWGSLRTS